MRGKPITESEGKEILRELARAVEESHEDHPQIQELLQDPHVLDKYIRQVKIDWHTIAARLQMDKGKVYTWYFNTWSNKTLGARMTMEDKELIKSAIRTAIQNNIPIDKEFRKSIYNKLSTTYHTLEVSCHVTNYLNSREAKSLMEECNFFVEKLSKHRGSSSTTPLADTSASHMNNSAVSPSTYNSAMNVSMGDSLRGKKPDYGAPQTVLHNPGLGSGGIVPGTLNVAIGSSVPGSGLQLPSGISVLHSGISMPIGMDMSDPIHLKGDNDKFCPHDSGSIGLDGKQYMSDKGHLGYFGSSNISTGGCDAGVGDSDGGSDNDGDKDGSHKMV